MTQDQPPATKAHHELSRSERIFVRISVWQTVLSLVGLFVAVVALYAALNESEAVRRQTAAAVWPYLQLTVNDHVAAEDALFELSLTNAGVGPTHIRDMRVTLAGQHVATWEEMLDSIDARPESFSQNAANRRVIRPGESVVIFGTRDRRAVQALRAVVANPENAIEFCYCSIFDECWFADSRETDAMPRRIASCPGLRASELFKLTSRFSRSYARCAMACRRLCSGPRRVRDAVGRRSDTDGALCEAASPLGSGERIVRHRRS